MITARSFRSRVFLVLLAMALVPTALAVAVGAFTLGELGSTLGTLGPWDAVAGSGQELADAAVRAAPEDSAVVAAAEAHREALSQSVRRSRMWGLVSERIRTLLPLAALLAALLVAGLSMLAARWLSRSIARPIHDLVGWTEQIARGEPLPPAEGESRDVREFHVLRRSLRSMSGELETARRREVDAARLRAWTEMARRVAHELKNPLTPMRMAATALARREDPATTESAAVLLEEIDRLDDMARTFSQFGRMPEGPPSDVDMVELARTLARRHARPDLPVEVSAEGDVPMVRGHHEVLARAVRNVLVNALEAVGAKDGAAADASPAAGPPVEIVVARNDGFVRVLVRDLGPGIPEEILESVWLPDITTKRQGTGLGLAMVRQAAEAHGGTATARNRPGGGAEVEIALPLGTGGGATSGQEGGGGPLGGRTVSPTPRDS